MDEETFCEIYSNRTVKVKTDDIIHVIGHLAVLERYFWGFPDSDAQAETIQTILNQFCDLLNKSVWEG